MKLTTILSLLALIFALALPLAGCSKKEEVAPAPSAPPTIGGGGAPVGTAAKVPPPGATPSGSDTFVNGSGK